MKIEYARVRTEWHSDSDTLCERVQGHNKDYEYDLSAVKERKEEEEKKYKKRKEKEEEEGRGG